MSVSLFLHWLIEMDAFKWMALSVDYLLIVIFPVVPFDMTEFCLLRYFLFFFFSLACIYSHHYDWNWIEVTCNRTYPESLVRPVGEVSMSLAANTMVILLLNSSRDPIRKSQFSRILLSYNLPIVSAMASVCIVNSSSTGPAIKPVLNRETSISDVEVYI